MAATTSMAPYLMPGVPVHQPSHLEGDPALATEILPGPPSLLSVQQAAQKRDLKKPVYSYLHPTDPGSTYSGIIHGTVIGTPEDGARMLKGKRSAVSGRAQRATARQHNGVGPDAASAPVAPLLSQRVASGSETYIVVPDDESTPSRSNSVPTPREDSAAPLEPKLRGKVRPKGKGKAKETEPVVRVKEEPQAFTLQAAPPEPTAGVGGQVNQDHCSSCRSHGALVYCDGCPRAFHLWCLNPPMEHVDEGDSRWFCPACMIEKHPPRKPPPGLFSPLIHLVQTSIPTEYQLPEDLRTFFRDVGTGPKGTYVDTSVVRQPRPNRFGLFDDRDTHRLRDKTGGPVLCFKCGMSALPSGLAAAAPAAKRARRSSARVANAEIWKSIVSCDYCNLHWHLDCLEPPLSSMPPIGKKWMCPNHAEKVVIPKLRIPKNAAAIEITKPKQPNNGNIEIIHPQTASTSQVKKVAVDEVLINGRRYRVPERIVILDFWNKVSNQTEQKNGEEDESELSSPLTSLSSLDDADDTKLSRNDEDLRAAQMLCNFQRIPRDQGPETTASTDSDDNFASTSKAPLSSKRTTSKPALSNGHSHSGTARAGPSTTTAKRKRNANGTYAGSSNGSRELRPRTRHAESTISVSSKDSSSPDDPFIATTSASVRVKQEEPEHKLETKPATSSRGRPLRRPSQKVLEAEDAATPKRGRKRKVWEEDELSDDEMESAAEQPKKSRTDKEGKGKERQKPAKSRKSPVRPASAAGPPSSAGATSGAPATPSLKIRLPRLSNLATRTSPATTKTVDKSAPG